MFQIGDIIFHGGEGACRVEAIGTLQMAGIDQTRKYYTLQPLNREGKLYAPLDKEADLRHIISKAEAEKLIAGIPTMEIEPYASSNTRYTNEFFRTFYQSHTCEDLLKVIRMIYEKKLQYQQSGKKIGSVDENNLRKAESLLHSELAVALDIPINEVAEYIGQKLQNMESTEE